jgi:UDP-glucose 4-epimerase
MVVPTFVRQALRGEPITVYGDGDQSRCFCHVQDIVRGLADLMECKAARGQIVNLGNNEEVTIHQLAERVRTRAGSNSDVVLIPYDEAYGEGFDDMRRRVPALDKAGELIGYRPTRPLDTILDDVIRYERDTIRHGN